jgi:hypothetical protein
MTRTLTALAQLIELLAEKGLTSTPDLVARTGYTDRAIRKAKAELECRNQSAAGTRVPEPECRSGTPVPQTEPECRNQSAASRAYIESPSEIDSYQEVKIIPLAPKPTAQAKPDTRKRGSRLDPDWKLPAEWRTWAKTNFPAVSDEQITAQADNFRDFWIAKPGAQACKLDWQATWRMWCRRGLVLGTIRQPQHTGQYTGSRIDKFAHIWEDQVAS